MDEQPSVTRWEGRFAPTKETQLAWLQVPWWICDHFQLRYRIGITLLYIVLMKKEQQFTNSLVSFCWKLPKNYGCSQTSWKLYFAFEEGEEALSERQESTHWLPSFPSAKQDAREKGVLEPPLKALPFKEQQQIETLFKITLIILSCVLPLFIWLLGFSWD